MSTTTNRHIHRTPSTLNHSKAAGSTSTPLAATTRDGDRVLSLASSKCLRTDKQHNKLNRTITAISATHSKRPIHLSRRFTSVVRLVVRWCVAALITTSLLPIIACVGAAILLFDGRPLFYRQYRVGKEGRLFRIWKFRTMRPNAESKTGPVWCQQDDQRVTSLGRALRALHLDELPQLFNVLRGEMNIVGPRPERPEFVQQLSRDIPGYLHRLRVKPGITGLAQIRQGYDTCIDDVRRKVALDRCYIYRASLLLDGLLILGTVPFVAREILDRLMQRYDRAADEAHRPVLRIVKEVGDSGSEIVCMRGITPADIERAVHHSAAEASPVETPAPVASGAPVAAPHGPLVNDMKARARNGHCPTPAIVPYVPVSVSTNSVLSAVDDPRSA